MAKVAPKILLENVSALRGLCSLSWLCMGSDPEGTGFLIPCKQECQQENKPEQDLSLQMSQQGTNSSRGQAAAGGELHIQEVLLCQPGSKQTHLHPCLQGPSCVPVSPTFCDKHRAAPGRSLLCPAPGLAFLCSTGSADPVEQQGQGHLSQSHWGCACHVSFVPLTGNSSLVRIRLKKTLTPQGWTEQRLRIKNTQ